MIDRLLTRQRGFSLIEVLVASVILFAVITTVTLIYRGGLLASAKATRSIELIGAAPAIASQITDTLQSSRGSIATGGGSQGEVTFVWEAERLDQGVVLSVETVGLEDLGADSDADKVVLWRVRFTITLNEFSRRFEYTEITW